MRKGSAHECTHWTPQKEQVLPTTKVGLNTWWTDAFPHGLTEGGKKISGKCKGGKRRFTLLTAHLHAHSPSRLKLQIRKPCEGGRRGNPRKPVSEAEESARAQVDESTITSRLSQGVEAGGERSAQRVMSLKLTAGSSVELQGSGDLMHHGQRGREDYP